MRYRIVQTGEGFIIQYKKLGLFWLNYKLHHFFESRIDGVCKHDGMVNMVYDSLEEAMGILTEIKKYPSKFMGHTIYYNIQLGNIPLYVDANSYCGTDDGDRACYKLYDKNIERLKEKITLKIEEENRRKEAILNEKKNKEIINIWYED